MKIAALVLLLCASLVVAKVGRADDALRIGSKRFTESYVVAEIAAAAARAAGERVEHRQGLGGTAIAYGAVEGGDIDVYPEYTGTLVEAILHLDQAEPRTLAALRERMRAKGLGVSEPLGFENTYALAVGAASPKTRAVSRISDLAGRRDLVIGLSNEFAGRQDGWPGLSRHYGLTAFVPETMDHGLAYEAMERGAIDVMEIYSTDAKIKRYGLRVLADDRHFFPSYEAVLVYRLDVPKRFPRAWAAFERLAGALDGARMVELNAEVELSGRSPEEAAASFVRRRSGAPEADEARAGRAARPSWIASTLRVIADDGARHVMLVAVSLALAMLVGVPLGIVAQKARWAGGAILAAVGVLQTLPALALLCFFIPVFGIGVAPTLAALFLYSLLPIVRNTFTGLEDIPSALRESAVALGLPLRTRLFTIELPLASRTVLAGIKTAAVINVGTATVAAFIGAGGFGRPISTGLNLNDTAMILQGAVPAALLALAVQGLFAALERVIVPRGLRVDARRGAG